MNGLDATPRTVASEHDTVWATSKSGQLRIAVGLRNGKWQVWALYTGTHDLAPRTRDFATRDEACQYANEIWAMC